jgi:Domain of unknown function (DUF4348)
MTKQLFITSALAVALLTACNYNSTTSTNAQLDETHTPTIVVGEFAEDNFNDFIVKFSTDTAFQLSRTKFPLKIKWYDLENERDSLIYRDRSSFEMMDFRKKKSTGQYDQWERKILVHKNNTSATIETRGIDNGITVDYLFEKVSGLWMLIEVDDSST